MPDYTAYPLCWPEGWKRTRIQVGSKFDQTLAKAVEFLEGEVQRLGARNPILSTNIKRKLDGSMYLNAQPEGGDSGVALYFTRSGKSQCMACDKYFKVWENVYAIAKTIEAMRGIERWGSTDLLDRAFTGFAALPTRESWHEVLGVSPNAPDSQVKAAYRELARLNHPDAPGGSHDAMSRINVALEQWEKRTK